MQFNAAVLRAANTPLLIEEIDSDELVYGQVLVDILYSSVCRSQLMEFNGLRGEDTWLPHLLGHEGFGKVVEVGPGVTKVSKGSNVVVGWISGEGLSATPPNLIDVHGNKVNAGLCTTFSTMSIVAENRVYLAPEGFRDEFLPLFGCSLLTGGIAALNSFNPIKHINTLILGFGGVGSSAAVILESIGAKNIVILDSSKDRREQAKNMGFINVFSSDSTDFKKILKEISGFDLCIESAGTSKSIELGFSYLSKFGNLVFTSHPSFGSVIQIDPFEMINGKTIVGVSGRDCKPDKDILTLATVLLESKLNLEFMLGKTYPLEKINEAFKFLETSSAGRPILKCSN